MVHEIQSGKPKSRVSLVLYYVFGYCNIIKKKKKQRIMEDFKKLVYAMRSAQKAYFKAQHGTDAKKLALEMSKELEKKVDDALKEPEDINQTKMW